MTKDNWNGLGMAHAPRNWTCGHCGQMVAGSRAFTHPNILAWQILPCPGCGKPTFFEGDQQMPGVAYGAEVAHLPPDVRGLYAEARNCMTVAAYTAAALATRKLLMNVAVSLGAKANDRFINYVNYLADEGYVPPNAKGWVVHIRDKGNDATHEIPATSRADAEDVLSFMEMILKLVYEYPNRVPKTP